MALILVIEDSEEVGAAICEALKISGHQVIFARSGKEALPLCRKKNFDAVVTDILMPDVEDCRDLSIRSLLGFKAAVGQR